MSEEENIADDTHYDLFFLGGGEGGLRISNILLHTPSTALLFLF